MSHQTLKLEKKDGLATITLSRPEKLNAISPAMITELLGAIEEISSDEAVRAVFLTAEGRAFSTGGDLESLLVQPTGPMETMGMSQLGARLISGIRTMPKPWVAAINGPAIGAGCTLALACDIILAAESARFSLAFMALGLHPDTGGVYLVSRLVGSARASELIFTGKTIDAHEAERIGLINRVVPSEALQKAAQELAMDLARGPTKAIGLAKATIHQAMTMDMDAVLEAEVRAAALSMATEDAREGIRAVLERRKPQFKGK